MKRSCERESGLIARLESIEEVVEHYPSLVGSYKAGVKVGAKRPAVLTR